MKTVLVTGASGFIGKNLCVQLEQNKELTILRFDRKSTTDDLKKLITKADFVFHLAGVNRPKDESDFNVGNRDLTDTVITLIKETGRKIPILITSSTQAELENPYGKSKKAAEKAVADFGKLTDTPTYIYRLPNVFGKWCKPNYNSVVATFCHNISHDLDITINDPNAVLTLVYIDDVVKDFLLAMDGTKTVADDGFCHIPREFTITLQSLADKLNAFKKIPESLIVPDLKDTFDRFLYATYLSYFDQKKFGYNLDMKSDQRGWLAEIIKSEHSGQTLVSRTKPGFTRGNHWHHTKIEKFLVIEGQAEIIFNDLNSGQTFTYKVNGEELRVIDIPVGYVHSIKNVGETDLLTIIWADEIFDPENPDTYYPEAI